MTIRFFLVLAFLASSAQAQSLQDDLQSIPLKQLASDVRQLGDAARGALVFHQPFMGCVKCHAIGSDESASLGPDLTKLPKDTTEEALIESILAPSKAIRKGFEPYTILTNDGVVISALLVERTAEKVVFRDVAKAGQVSELSTDEIDQIKASQQSIMPAGQMNQLNSRQQFYDLVRYLIEIRDGGGQRAQQLQPPASLLVVTIPEYENHLDHAGLIGSWDEEAFRRGEAIYKRVCANCHGTHDQPGSLPTSLRFAEGKFKNGSDPLSMYRTMTHGFGQMAAQTWMVPSQKYDVVYYIRQAYLRTYNPSQFIEVDPSYLTKLPKGDTRGPEPSNIEAWSAMDYGSSLVHTYEIPGPKHNLAYKGIAVRLDPGAGGVSRGQHWMVFDTDTLRMAAAWNAGHAKNKTENFIDWRAIQFNGEHGVHPRIVGETVVANATGPGWANPDGESFRDNQRVLGRDGRQYGPLPRTWGQYRGMYYHGQNVILSYTIGHAQVIEMPRAVMRENAPPLLVRTFNIGPRDRDLLLQVADLNPTGATLRAIEGFDEAVVQVSAPDLTRTRANESWQFDGQTFVEFAQAERWDMTKQDFTIFARIKTKKNGTIFSVSDGGPKWIPNGQALFLRGGKLAFDIGWVGAVAGRTKVNDDRWHNVALTWEKSKGQVRLYVDGKLDGEGVLRAKDSLPKQVARIGFTAPNFPQPDSYFEGEIAEFGFRQELIDAKRLNQVELKTKEDQPAVNKSTFVFRLADQKGERVVAANRNDVAGTVQRGEPQGIRYTGPSLAGFSPATAKAKWTIEEGSLRLRIPAGPQPLKFSVWIPSSLNESRDTKPKLAKTPNIEVPTITDGDIDLAQFTHGGPKRWSQNLTTPVMEGTTSGPLAVDTLLPPESNPWLALTRFTGLDFYPDGRLAICSWDGDVWIATPRRDGDRSLLDWQRIASGLFQPLGLKIVNDKIHVICRDQLAVLHDLNGDNEIDFYQCLNNDHQVTEHFHEFAMGLQVDSAGNFYYAKSGCHGKPAVVPHHGTLLKVSADGTKTEILANGFRAANGVCLNPDGSFVVTDQEGFWNPKNRINWVTVSESGKPNFYGNMLGYHDVTDTSDSAMVQPLCWITNAFDRSPAELLWVDSPKWGVLNGSLLNLSYGYGKVFLVLHERVGDTMQGGMIELPLPAFPTGVMRGRYNPLDGQLYVCGMFAWAGNATHPGGLYRIRTTGQPMRMPISLKATLSGVELTFTEPIDPASASDLKNYAVEAWDLKRSAKYGSEHINQRNWSVTSAQLSADGKVLQLTIPSIAPTWGMEINYHLKSRTGEPIAGKIHNTIHLLSTP